MIKIRTKPVAEAPSGSAQSLGSDAGVERHHAFDKDIREPTQRGGTNSRDYFNFYGAWLIVFLSGQSESTH